MGFESFSGPPQEMIQLLISAKEGNEDALLVLLNRSEPLFFKYGKLPDGKTDPDLRQELLIEWFAAIKSFDLSRYYSEENEEADQS